MVRVMRDDMCMLRSVDYFNDTATTEIYTYGHTLSLHDALPICLADICLIPQVYNAHRFHFSMEAYPLINEVYTYCCTLEPFKDAAPEQQQQRSEEHTSELQSLMRRSYAVFCLQKKTKTHTCSLIT